MSNRPVPRPRSTVLQNNNANHQAAATTNGEVEKPKPVIRRTVITTQL